MNTQIQIIDFHGDQIVAVEINGKPYVAVKPICERIGLDWKSQYNKIKEDAILSEGVALCTIPLVVNAQESVCLPLDLINGWLFGISIKSIKDNVVRDRVILYKRECYRALYHHFHKSAPQEVIPPQTCEDTFNHAGIKMSRADLTMSIQLIRITERIHNTAHACELWRNLNLPVYKELLPYSHPVMQGELIYDGRAI